MCLAIPGQIVEVVDEANRLAKVDVAGVQRTINIGLLDDDGEGVGPGDWVLIHVGFAMSQVDEEEAIATRELLERMGAGLRGRARGAQGERDRVSEPTRPARCGDHCITCADEGVPMQVERVDERARPRAVRGRRRRRGAPSRSRWSSRSRPATGCSSTPGVALVGLAGMKYVDEFRDPELGRVLAGGDPRRGRAGPPLQVHGGLRRPHALDLQVRRRRPAARQRRARARARAARCA